MRNITMFIVIAIMTTSCSWPMSKGRVMKVYDCYDGKDTGIESLIDVEGYYVVPYFGSYGTTIAPEGDMIMNKLIFYKDGIFHRLFDSSYASRPDGREDIPAYLKEVIEDPAGALSVDYYNELLGRYSISGDTIKLQIVARSGAYLNTSVFEYWLKVIDRHTMSIVDANIKSSPNSTRINQQYRDRYMRHNADTPVYYVPLERIPSIEGHWMLKDKRFICKD